MSRKLVLTTFFITVLIGTLALSFVVQRAEASGTICIRADGSIEPPTAPIYTADNITYTLTANITADADGIVIERDNIVVDGAGYTVEGGGSGTGIDLSQRNNVTVKNTTIQNFFYSIYLNHTNKIALINNNIANNGIGILLNSSLISIVSGNNITNNDWAGVGLISSSNNSISGNSVTNNTWDGIGLTFSSNSNSISGNNIANNHDGIHLSDSSSNSIYHNNFRDNTQQRDMFNNTWDDGYPSGGNYWGDYTGNDMKSGPCQNVTGSDGIGDTSYVIDAGNVDNYPLMKPYVPFENQTVYIRTDGSVDPSGAPILRQGDLYTLSGNITSNADGIVVEKSKITIDGAGYTVQGIGDPSSNGLYLSGINNVAIKNMKTKAFSYGILLASSSNYNTISGNNVTNNRYGIGLSESSNNTISGNNITANDLDGICLYYFSDYNVITGNNVTANSGEGIWLSYSSNNQVAGNDMTNNGEGIGLSSSSNNCIAGNNVTNHSQGIRLYESSNNILVGNNLDRNADGMLIYSSSNNRFYHNNFINNILQLFILGGHSDVWDDGYPSGGNYWSDYTGVDIDNDGISDTARTIDASNTDRYPLMGIFSDFNATLEQGVQTICNSSISSFQYNGASIRFNVTGEDGTAGFCRICIPTALMNATYGVFVNGTEIQCNLLPCSNSTHNYLYFNYTHSTEEVVIIPEFLSVIILPLFMLFTMLVVVFMQRKIPRKQKNSR